ncbi:transcription elongation factor A N-terminal and central domain-containing protein [Clarias gariepinus]
MEVKEITRMAIQIEKLHKDRKYEDISCLLTDIFNTNVTLEQLQSTDIAMNIYQLLKSCPVESIRKRGKCVLSKWKRLYGSLHDHKNIKETNQAKDCEAIKQDKSETSKQVLDKKVNDDDNNDNAVICFKDVELGVSNAASSSKAKTEQKEETLRHPPEPQDLRTISMVPPLMSSSTNSPVLRNKCVELLIQALNTDQTDPELINQLAHIIETDIDSLHGCNPHKYKSCIRSKVANLKNPKNPHLREGLLTGTLAPGVFVRMSAQEMAGDELRQLRQGYTAAGISEHQLPQGPEGTATTKVRCQRCEGMDCRLTQVSRGTLFLPSWVKRGSVDEEAMTFMSCANCGAQWYHNRWVCL